jgi:hypothetical protein
MDANVKETILNRPRAKEIAARPHPSDTLQELRRKYGGPGVSDEEVVSRFFTSKEDVERMRAAGPPRIYGANGNPLVNLVGELSKKNQRNSVYIKNSNFSLRLEKCEAI